MSALHARVELLQGIHFHVAAFVARTVVGGSWDEFFARALFLQSMEHSHFGGDDEGVG